MKNGFSQEALSHATCSVSHLSYFEKGKKHLRKETIEILLRKVNISKFVQIANIGQIRQKFNTIINHIESYNFDDAKIIYNELKYLYLLISGHIFYKNYDYRQSKEANRLYRELMS